MKKVIKRIACYALGSTPVYGVLKRRLLNGNPVTILCYHTLGADTEPMDAWTVLRVSDFRQHLQFLRRDYDIVSLDQALEGQHNAERPKAVLTFDDGDVGLYNFLLPIVRAEAIPVTVYVATAQIQTGQPYWFDRVINALQSQSAFEIDLSSDGLGRFAIPASKEMPNDPDRWLAISNLLECLKTLSPTEREMVSDRICGVTSRSGTRIDPLHPMSLAQLREFSGNKNVTIGAHSHCHNLLDQIPIEEAQTSIVKSRQLLQDWTGQDIRHFAYPNGNHNAEVEAAVASAGFSSAVALDDRFFASATEPYSLSRLAIGRYDDVARFKLRLLGI